MHIINIDNKYVFKTKSLDLNCYSVNSTVKGACKMNIIFNQTISMLECVSIAKKHIENNIAKNSSGTKDIDNRAKLLNRIAEYAVLIFINRNYYKQSIITCDDEVMHYNKPLNTVIKKGLCLGEIDQAIHAQALKHARKLINQLIG